MLKNLKNSMNEKKVTNKDLSILLNISEKSVYSKINEKTDFTLEEIKKCDDSHLNTPAPQS